MNPPEARSIVIVDDEKSYVDLMSQMLEDNLRCRVHAFTRPLEALGALPTLNPPVVVTDYFMPQISGLDLIRLATPLLPASAFVLITGHNLDAMQEEVAQLRSLRGMLQKPFGWRALAAEVMRVWPDHTPAPVQRADATSV